MKGTTLSHSGTLLSIPVLPDDLGSLTMFDDVVSLTGVGDVEFSLALNKFDIDSLNLLNALKS